SRLPNPPGVNGWKAVAGGSSSAYGLTDAGQLYTISANSILVLVPFPSGVTNWTAVAAGSSSSVLTMAGDGRLYHHAADNLGVLTNDAVPFPAGVTNWLAVAAGSTHR